jgi:hypothetical protein
LFSKTKEFGSFERTGINGGSFKVSLLLSSTKVNDVLKERGEKNVKKGKSGRGKTCEYWKRYEVRFHKLSVYDFRFNLQEVNRSQKLRKY